MLYPLIQPLLRPLVQGLGAFRPSGGAAAIDSDAQAWATAVTAAGGTYSEGTLSALSVFFASAKANGYNSALYCFNPLAGDQLAAALIQRTNGTWAPVTNVGYVSGDYTEATGLTGNVIGNKYLRTGLIPSASLTVNDTHMAWYSRSATAGNAGRTGMGATVSNSQRMLVGSDPTTTYHDHCSVTDGRVALANARPEGLIVQSRRASNSLKVYGNGEETGSNTGASTGTLPDIEIYVGAINISGAASEPGPTPMGMYSIGSGLSLGQAESFYIDIQTLQTALGRQV
jgi:hypothetical protein